MISVTYHPAQADEENEYICTIEVDNLVLNYFPINATNCEVAGVWDDVTAQAWLDLHESELLGEAQRRIERDGLHSFDRATNQIVPAITANWKTQYQDAIDDFQKVIDYVRPPVANLTEALDVLDDMIKGMQEMAEINKKTLKALKRFLE